MSKVYKLQNGPFIVFENATENKVTTFNDNVAPYSICDWVNNCLEDEDVVITNSPLFERLIKDRCKVGVKFEKFTNTHKK